VRHAIDVLVVAYLVYRGLLIIKGTRAAPMLGGLALTVLLYVVSRPLGLVTLAWLLGNFLSYLLLVVVILFQDEIRRGLTKVGLQPIFRKTGQTTLVDKTIEDLTLTCSKFQRDKLGALIVIQREVGLEEFLEESVVLDAQVNRKLLYSIFLRDSPLHDGAVIIDGERVRTAGAVLPLSYNPDLDPNLGTRHRAALGISERSDAVVIVVSEETGAISLARDGRLIRNLDPTMLRERLQRSMSGEEDPLPVESLE
jgi:diadenylate cyclase